MTDDAPDHGPGYPSGGKMIGPAWRRAWRELTQDPTHWHARSDLMAAMASEVPEASPKTLTNLLQSAHRAGLVERQRATGRAIRYRATMPG